MITMNSELIEKIKLYNLGEKFIKSDFSPEYLDWDKDQRKFFSLLKEGRTVLFTVKIRREALTEDFCGTLPGRLLEMEWHREDILTFRMLNLPMIQETDKVPVRIGTPIPLTFHDSQLFFNITATDLLDWLKTEKKNIPELVRHAEVRHEDWQSVFEKAPECIEKNTNCGERYISVGFSLEKFLFSNERIQRYFTAVDDADSLDFALTYRNSDIVNAIKNDSLEKYLKTCDVIKSGNRAFPLLLSLLYPSYLKDFSNFLKKLMNLDPPENLKDDIWKQICLSVKYRQEVSPEHCAEVLKKLHEEFADLEKLIDETEERFAGSQEFSAEDKAKAYDRDRSADAAELGKRWNNEDLVRFEDIYSPVTGKKSCKTILSVINAGRESGFWKIFDKIRREDVPGGLFTRVDLPLKYIFEPASPDDNRHAGIDKGSFAEYFYLSEWNNGRLITSIDDRGSIDDLEKIYDCFLTINMFLEYASAQLSELPFLREKLLTAANYFADIELDTAGKLLRHGKRIAYFSQDCGMLKLMPESHILLFVEFEKHEAEAKAKEADIRAEVQKDNFVTINHSIKNLISSVDGALSRLERRLPSEQEFMCNLLKQAKQGVVIASDLANAITCSYRSTGRELWHEDLLPENAKWSIQDILHDALNASIPHMFFRRYSQYEQESKNYFPDKDEVLRAESEWYDLPDIKTRIEWINQHMFRFELNDADVANVKIGNTYSTKTHLYVLFNEILLNAIKAASFVDLEQRKIDVSLTSAEGNIIVDISNSSDSNRGVSGGYGRIIIDNYKSMFNMPDFYSGYDTNAQCYQVKFTLPFSK